MCEGILVDPSNTKALDISSTVTSEGPPLFFTASCDVFFIPSSHNSLSIRWAHNVDWSLPYSNNGEKVAYWRIHASATMDLPFELSSLLKILKKMVPYFLFRWREFRSLDFFGSRLHLVVVVVVVFWWRLQSAVLVVLCCDLRCDTRPWIFWIRHDVGLLMTCESYTKSKNPVGSWGVDRFEATEPLQYLFLYGTVPVRYTTYLLL